MFFVGTQSKGVLSWPAQCPPPYRAIDNIDEILHTFKCRNTLSCNARMRTIIPDMALKITFINHATLLIQMDGVNVLTDPIYSKTVSFAFPRRQKPGIPFDELPPIDYILVSHSDYDHLNLKTLRMLSRKGPSAIVIPKGLALYARKSGFEEIVELNTWESTQRPNITASALRGTALAQHAAVLSFSLKTTRSILPEIPGMRISFKSSVLNSRSMQRFFPSVLTNLRNGSRMFIFTPQRQSRRSLISKRGI